MNLDEQLINLPLDYKPLEYMPRVALPQPNAANAVRLNLVVLGLNVLDGMPGVFITGSNVYRPAMGLPFAANADIDIMLIGDEADELRTKRGGVAHLLKLAAGVMATAPSMTEERDKATLPGVKYLTPDGRTVDIWGMADVHAALQQYPEHSHASSRMAWDCEHGCLIMYLNTAAVSASTRAPSSLDDMLAGL